jgi:hypothetical protein
MDKALLIVGLAPLPKGYSGTIKVVNPQSRIIGGTAIVSYDMDETESIYEQSRPINYSYRGIFVITQHLSRHDLPARATVQPGIGLVVPSPLLPATAHQACGVEQMKWVATEVRVKNSGHSILEKQPTQTSDAL